MATGMYNLEHKMYFMEDKRKTLQDSKTHDRIHEHISNKSDVISEDDIKDAKTENFDEDQSSIKDAELPEAREDGEENRNIEDGDSDSGMVTPWNILGA